MSSLPLLGDYSTYTDTNFGFMFFQLPLIEMKMIDHAVVVVVFLVLSAAPAAGYWSSVCSVSAGNYTPRSTYDENLKLLFSSLPKVSSSSALFASDAAGSSKEEVAYAAAQCRGDTSTSTCNRCVIEALQDAQMACAFCKDATMLSELCTVQFFNMKISWTSSVKIAVKADGSYAIKQRKGFELGVDTLISAITSLAANSPQRFATSLQEVDDNGTKYTTYGLAQCTCLKKLLVPHVFPGFMGGRKALLWWVRALNLWRSTAATSGIYLQSTKTTHVEKTILILVAVGVSVVLILALLTLFFFWRKQKKRSGKISWKQMVL